MADNITAAWRFLRGKGLSPAQAAGVIGSMQGESGPQLNPAAVNPNGGATGIAQWLGGRKTAAVQTKQLGPQLNHLWHELNTSERAALTALKGTHTPEQAAIAWQKVFERGAPFEQKYNLRASNARKVFNRLSSDPGSASSGGGGGGGGGAASPLTRTTTTTTPGVDNRAARASLISSFLEDKSSDPVDFAVQANVLKDIPATTASKTVNLPGATQPAPGGGIGGGTADQLTRRADAIDAQHLPYSWGGGHGGKTSIHQAVPLDCSGAVSKVLGIDPRVSGDFEKWGSPGAGGGKGVTIYANGHHVFMSINGHFFGTSRTNPGGGAGWIPSSAMSPEYLKGFTVRHSAA